MRLPSLSGLASQAARTARRFPLTLLAAFSALAAGWALVGRDAPPDHLLRWLGTSALGISLSAAGTLWAERRPGPARKPLAAAAAVVALALIWWAWHSWTDEIAGRRFVQLAVAAHLLAAFLPYLGAGEQNGFWQYNRRLLLRFALAAFYAGVLFAGLAVALAAIDKLLGIHVPPKTYGRLWITVAFGFHPWFFLGGLPARLSDLEEDRSYPGALKVFSQFILLPIVAVYLAILTVYLGKVLVTQVWPSGWIGYLVSSVGAAGMFSLLLVHPIDERRENRWVRAYARFFYAALAPSIVMLLLAVGKRIGQYGITENRYFLVVLALWLAAMAVLFGGFRTRRIILIPVTLCAVALATSFGPWGAYTVSRRSQTARLSTVLAANGMFAEGRVRPASGPVSLEDRREMSAGLEYLLRTHGPESVASWFEAGIPDADSLRADDPRHRVQAGDAAQRLLAGLGVTYLNAWEARPGADVFLNASPAVDVVPLQAVEYLVRAEQPLPVEIQLEGHAFAFRLGADSLSVEVVEDGAVALTLPLDSLRVLLEEGRVDPARGKDHPVEIRGESPELAVTMRVRSATGREAEGRVTLHQLTADFLLRLGPS